MLTRYRLTLLAGCALFAWPGYAPAQMHHVDKPERVTRAVGVYEWTGDLSKPTASRFVPVSLFIDGKLEDAGLYQPRPVPFALESGDLYTVQRSGEPAGTLDLQSAERVVTGNSLADDNPAGSWYGFGKFTPDAPPKVPPALHKTAHVGVIQSSSGATVAAAKGTDGDDGKPHMSRRTPADADGSASTTAESSGTGAGSKRTESDRTSDDTDRPTLARRDPSQDASRKRTVGGRANQASVTSVGPAPGDDPDRPTLSHKTAAEEETKALTGMPADLHQAVAVSDPVLRDPHPFARPWEDSAERASTLAAMAALAKPRVAAYLSENRLVPSAEVAGTAATTGSVSTEGIAANTENGAGAPPKLQRGKPTEYGGAPVASSADTETPHAETPAKTAASIRPRTGKRPVTTKAAGPAPLLLRDEQLAGFTLTYGGLPTFVYTASVPAALASPSDLPTAARHATAFVTVVAQRLPSGELQVALSAVTDSQHLDRSPRLHLIDAVDPDASHRASLLFELRGSASRQFALYRLTSAKAENTFTSASIE